MAKEIVEQVQTMQPDDEQQRESTKYKAVTIETVKPEQLGQYVVEQAISGLFKKVVEKVL